MRAMQFDGTPGVRLAEVPRPRAAGDETCVRVRYTGICGSDIFKVSGKNPRVKVPLIPGHEFSGEIAELGPEAGGGFRIGQRVTVFPTIGCMQCEACLAGEYQLCRPFRMIGAQRDGAFAEYVVVPSRNLIPLPDGLDDASAALVEPLAVAVHGVRLARPEAGDAAVVLGAGPIGLLAAQVLRLAGCHPVMLSEVSPPRVEAATRLGYTCIDASRTDPIQEVLHMTSGRGADLLIECVGHPSTIPQLIGMGRPRSRAIIVGAFHQAAPVDFFEMSKKEQTVVASWQYSVDDFRRSIRFLSQGVVSLEGIITHRLPLEQAQDGIDMVRAAGDCMKVLLHVSEREGGE